MCWHLVPEFAGSNPAEAVGFLGRKNPHHALLRRGSEAVGPMPYFTACKRSQNGVELVISAKFTGQYSRPIVPPVAARISRVVQTWRYLAAEVRMSEGGGK